MVVHIPSLLLPPYYLSLWEGVIRCNHHFPGPSCKVFEGVSPYKSKTYWRSLKEPKRRYPDSKGKKVLFPQWDEGILDYVTSLKKVYVPLYHEQIKDKEVSLHWKEEVEKGISLVVYYFDGPRLEDGSSTLKVA